jgi:hypothetical protein
MVTLFTGLGRGWLTSPLRRTESSCRCTHPAAHAPPAGDITPAIQTAKVVGVMNLHRSNFNLISFTPKK